MGSVPQLWLVPRGAQRVVRLVMLPAVDRRVPTCNSLDGHLDLLIELLSRVT